MQESECGPAERVSGTGEPSWRDLAHRWFVQYNPLYLVSAALVLVGVFLVSRGLAQSDGLQGELWLTAVVELYQMLLIGGAALLYRIGQQRAAVMLALLEVVYICDLTFQTEVSAYLGVVGLTTSGIWFALFTGKLLALAWALRLRLSSAAHVLPLVGAAGLAVLPHVVCGRWLSPSATSTLLAGWVFSLTAAGLWSRPAVHSRERLSAWGETVLQRATRASWIIWLVLTVGHVLWWSVDHDLQPYLLLFVGGILLSVRWIRRETAVWCVAALVVGAVALCSPTSLPPTALMAAVVLALRGWRGVPITAPGMATPCDTHPYREPHDPACTRRTMVWPPWDRPEAMRLYVAALSLVHLSIWTVGWHGEPWIEHQLWLDLSLTAILLVLGWRRRTLFSALPLVGIFGHLALQSGRGPSSTLGWGVLTLSAGFVLLLVGLAVSYLMRKVSCPPSSDRPARP